MSNLNFNFKIKNNLSNIKVGQIDTLNGIINTPCFVPVATNGAIKSCLSEQIDQIEVDLVFCNTYHLIVNPGTKIISDFGGIHKFMNRKKPIITDSGGFQIFSLVYGGVSSEIKSAGKKKLTNNLVKKISEEGVLFNSYFDGKKILLTPESSINAQKEIGADIIIPLDELLPFHSEEKRFKKSFERTHRWQVRSLIEHEKDKKHQSMYCVIHGGIDSEYRKKSVEILSKYNFDGFAIGGSLGKNITDIKNVLDYTIKYIPQNKPIHLLGIADIPTVLMAIEMGVDTFDSSYPTKCARHGIMFSDEGNINITQSRWKEYHQPISMSPIVKNYSASYIHHLFKAREMGGGILTSLHNIWYLTDLCKRIRDDKICTKKLKNNF